MLGFQKFSRWYRDHCGVLLFSMLGLFGSDMLSLSNVVVGGQLEAMADDSRSNTGWKGLISSWMKAA